MTPSVLGHCAEIGSSWGDESIWTQVVGERMAVTDGLGCGTSESSHHPAHPVFSYFFLPQHLLGRNVPLELPKGTVLGATVVLTDEAEVSPVEIREPDRPEFVEDLHLQLWSGQPERVELNSTKRFSWRTRAAVSEINCKSCPSRARVGKQRTQRLQKLVLAHRGHSQFVADLSNMRLLQGRVRHRDGTHKRGCAGQVDNRSRERGDSDLADQSRILIKTESVSTDAAAGGAPGRTRGQFVHLLRPASDARKAVERGRRIMRELGAVRGAQRGGPHARSVSGIRIQGIPSRGIDIDARGHSHEGTLLGGTSQVAGGPESCCFTGEIERGFLHGNSVNRPKCRGDRRVALGGQGSSAADCGGGVSKDPSAVAEAIWAQ